MRLNLGCGEDIKPGYTNVDFRELPGVDVVADLSAFPWPFQDRSADEILMLDFLEHFPYAQTKQVLLECYRVLRPTGELVVQVPDATHLMMALTRTGPYLCNACGHSMQEEGRQRTKCLGCGQHSSAITEAAMMRLFGGQDYAGNFHYTCFTQQSLWEKAATCGFINMQMEEMDHQFKNWNLKARLKMGDLW